MEWGNELRERIPDKRKLVTCSKVVGGICCKTTHLLNVQFFYRFKSLQDQRYLWSYQVAASKREAYKKHLEECPIPLMAAGLGYGPSHPYYYMYTRHGKVAFIRALEMAKQGSRLLDLWYNAYMLGHNGCGSATPFPYYFWSFPKAVYLCRTKRGCVAFLFNLAALPIRRT